MPGEPSSKVNIAIEQAIQAVLSDRPIAYHAALARALGSVTAGVLLSQLLYWQPRTQDAEGWFWKTQKDIYDETALTRREHDTARTILKRAGVLEEKLKGVPARMHYRVNLRKLIELLSSYHTGSSPSTGQQSSDQGGPGGGTAQFARSGQSSLAESAKLVWREAPNQVGGKRRAIAKSTTETTTETSAETIESSTGQSTKRRDRSKRGGAGGDSQIPAPAAKPQAARASSHPTQIGELLSSRLRPPLAPIPGNGPQSPAKASKSAAIPERDSEDQPTLEEPSASPTKRRRKGRKSKHPEWVVGMMEWFADELHDDPALRTSVVTRATNLWTRSGLSEEAFRTLMFNARTRVKQRGNIQKAAHDNPYQRNRVPYFFAVLETMLAELKAEQVGGSGP